MAIRSLITHLRPLSFRDIRINGVAKGFSCLRGISSNTLSTSLPHDSELCKYNDDIDLKHKLLSLVHPPRSATSVLQKWVSEGRKVSIYDLRHISKQLVRRGCYKHALQVMKWMEDQERFKISEADHALRSELTIKVSTLQEAEDYFTNLPNIASQKASYLHLLNSYVKEHSITKAEVLMTKMSVLGANVTPHPFNAMMKLYIATSQFELVLSVISEMEQNNIPKNVLSYNLWMSACNELYGVENVEIVYKKMLKDKNVKVGWSSLCTLANIYMRSGLVEKAIFALENAEKKLSFRNHFGYFFLITNYASLKNKEGVIRVWEACRRVNAKAKLTCANYMCVLLCFIKLGDVKEAERVFLDWESKARRYDVRVSNVLLGGYVRGGLMKKCEAFYARMLKKGACANYKTWEILMEGYVRTQNMEKVVFVMKEGFKVLKGCDWRPSSMIVLLVFEYFEKNGDLKEANGFLKVLRGFDLASLSVYRCLIRMCVAKEEPFGGILEMMKDDEVEMDDETMALVQATGA